MKSIPNISKAEWLIMRVIWAKSSATANEVADELASATTWKPKTIMTMLKRLVEKGALEYEKKGRAFHYSALVEEMDCKKAESRSFLQRVYNGSLKPMLANFVEDLELSDKEIAELKQLLDEKSPKCS